MQNGVLLMGGASFLMLLYTRGSVDALVVMYAINVFVTFSLSQLGMIKYWRRKETRARHRQWRQPMVIAVVCFVLCAFILVVNLFEKFTEGAWLTVVITGAVVAVCLLIKRHYNGVFGRLKRLDQILTALPVGPPTKVLEIQKKKPTAVLLVGSFSGLGIHSLLTVMKLFPRYFANVVFMSVGVIDSATFQGVEEVDQVREQTEEALLKYVDLARGMGIPADYRMAMGTEAITGCERLASEVAKEYERSIFFSGKLISSRRSGGTACCTTRPRTRSSAGCSSPDTPWWCCRSVCWSSGTTFDACGARRRRLTNSPSKWTLAQSQPNRRPPSTAAGCAGSSSANRRTSKIRSSSTR